MRRSLILPALLQALALSAPAQAFTLSDFDVPESIVRDPQDGAYYVSNVNGGPTDKDSNGYISKIASSGNILIQRYIGGEKEGSPLHAPKGLLILENEIWVTDIDAVKVFDKHAKTLTKLLDFAPLGAKFLNDLTYDPSRGIVYVSDMLGDRIYSIDRARGDRIDVFKEGAELGNPNGLLFNPRSKNLLAVTWKGRIIEVDRLGRVRVLKKDLSTLDGVDDDGQGALYVSSFEKGEIYRIEFFGRGQMKTVFGGLTTPADISYDRQADELLVPSFKGGTVTTIPMKNEKASGS